MWVCHFKERRTKGRAWGAGGGALSWPRRGQGGAIKAAHAWSARSKIMLTALH